MVADRITASVGVTRNLGDYESLRVDVAFETALEGSETPQEAFDRAWAVVDAELTEKVQESLGV